MTTLPVLSVMCFNGATDFHQWKRIYEFIASQGITCFNGATDFHQWKQQTPVQFPAFPYGASMGPLTFISGNRQPEKEPDKEPEPASMGPLTFISGNTA